MQVYNYRIYCLIKHIIRNRVMSELLTVRGRDCTGVDVDNEKPARKRQATISTVEEI